MMFKSKSIAIVICTLLFSIHLSSQRYGIVAKDMDVKAKPSKKAKVIGQIKKNDKVPLLDEVDGHFKIKTAEGEGFIKYKHISKIEYGTVSGADLSDYSGIVIEPLNKAYQEFDPLLIDMISDTRLSYISFGEFESIPESERCKVLIATPYVDYPEIFELQEVKFSLKVTDCNGEAIAAYKKKKWANALNPDKVIRGVINKTIKAFKEDL